MKLSEMNQEQLENYVDGGEYSDQDVIDLYKDLANQKAITELAVKRLKEISNHHPGIADATLSEIERLQNEQT